MSEPTTPDPVAPYLHCECGTRLISGERCPLCGWGWNDTLSAEPDPVAARLAEIRALIAARDDLVARLLTGAVDAREFNAAQDRLAGEMPALLAAVEAVLALAADWSGKAQELDAMADRADARGADPLRTTLISARAQAHSDCAQLLRDRISMALLGEGVTDGS